MHIFITGASTGIGAELAKFYAKPGIVLGLTNRDHDRLSDVAQACEAKGAKVYAYCGDVSDDIRMREIVANFISQTRRIDLVIANAGIRGEEDELFQDRQITERLININYMGVVNTFAPFLSLLIEQKCGQLAVISSISSIRATPNSGAYSASKAAVNIWCEGLRLRLHKYKIPVTVINLGFVSTAMTEGLTFNMPGILTAERAAQLIAKSIATKRRVVTIPWQSKFIWNCFWILPGFIYDEIILWAKSRHK